MLERPPFVPSITLRLVRHCWRSRTVCERALALPSSVLEGSAVGERSLPELRLRVEIDMLSLCIRFKK